MKNHFEESELIINPDGSAFHIHVKPEHLAGKVILVGDPGRVAMVAAHFDAVEAKSANREFHSVTGTYKGCRMTVLSTGIGCDNIDIVMNELDALANIDFKTRGMKPQLTSLKIVRVGTCGGLQPFTPIGTFVCSEKSIGIDGLLDFYAGAATLSVIWTLRQSSSVRCSGRRGTAPPMSSMPTRGCWMPSPAMTWCVA